MKKSLEASKARAREQETENDNFSAEYTRDLEASVEQHKSLSDYARALHSYGGKAMAASIKLTKEWISTEHPSIDSSGFDKLFAQRKGKESGARPLGHSS